MKNILTWVVGAALVVSLSGCQSKQESAEVQKKLDQMQKQLDEARKELDESKAAQAAKDAEAAAANAAANTAKAAKSATSTPTKKISDASATAKSKAVESAGASKAAIQKTTDEIAATKAEVAKNREELAEVKRAAAAPPSHTLSAGTPIAVRTTSMITTKTASTGSTFEASLEEPLEVEGYLVAPKGATVSGVVANADPGGRVKGVASMSLELRSITMEDGRVLPIRTSSVSQLAKQSKGKDAAKVGIASGIGAAIGAIAGGGKGAAIGAGAGAAGGTGMVLGTRGAAAEVPAETVLQFSLSAPAKFQELRK